MNEIRKFLEILFNPGEFIFDLSDKEINSYFQFEVSNRLPLPLICLNPLDGNRDNNPTREFHSFDKPRRADCNITKYRNFLIEMDNGALEEQIYIMEQKYQIPYSTAVWSGNKSVHFIISLKEELTESQWRKIANALTPSNSDREYFKRTNQWLGIQEADSACKNPSRATRVPGIIRPDTNKKQYLIKSFGRVSLDELLTKIEIQKPRKIFIDETGSIPKDKAHEIYMCKLLELSRIDKGGRHNFMCSTVFFASKVGISREQCISDILNYSTLPRNEIEATVNATSWDV